MRLGSWATGAAPLVPAPAVADEAEAATAGQSPFPATGATGATAAVAPVVEAEDEQPVRRRHPYTWLHLLVLALVAFVLGFLIVALWNQGRSNGAHAASSAAAVVVVLAPPASSYPA
jgi:hypothetical protein